MTKVYIVNGFAKFGSVADAISAFEFTYPFGSVTEVCKFLKKTYNFPEKDSRKLIITAFGKNTKLYISMAEEDDGLGTLVCRSVRISQHKVDIESRIHGEAD